MKLFRVLSVLIFLSQPAWGAEHEGKNEAPKPAIGLATMTPDRTINLWFWIQTDKILADYYKVYKPDDPKYQEIFKHIGGIRPGEYKPIPPWP